MKHGVTYGPSPPASKPSPSLIAPFTLAPDRFTATVPAALPFWRYVPDAPGPVPLVLFLHGAAERGTDLDGVLRHGLPARLAAGWRPGFAVVAPQCPPDRWWDPDPLAALLDHALATLPVDPARVYLTGLSMGGFGAWGLATRYPDRFAALAPVCGGGSPYFAGMLVDLPTWAFHGALDPVVPLRHSVEMVEAVRACGGAPRLTVYDDLAHDAWTRAYADPALYEWMLTQRRAGP